MTLSTSFSECIPAAGLCAGGPPSLGDYFDSFPGLDSDFSRDDLYGYGSFGDFRRGRSYDDYFGGPGSYGNVGPLDRKDTGKDECSRIEADGVPLAELLLEAAENLPANISEAPAQVLELVRFFSSEDHRTFLLGHCPQAVALAVLLEAEIQATPASLAGADDAVQRAVSQLSELLDKAPSLRSPFKALPVWTGKPWGQVLGAAQRRTGILLFPVGEQQFHVDFIPAANWSIWANRRCRGRRDLGNLQGTLLTTCLEKCLSHPSCRSATFWHWQPGGMGFDQRCFLSSSCTFELSTDEGAEGAFLFEKRMLVRLLASGAEAKALLKRRAMPKGWTTSGGVAFNTDVAGEMQPPGWVLSIASSSALEIIMGLMADGLGDVWWSEDEGTTWNLMQQDSSNSSLGGLERQYAARLVNDVWYADLSDLASFSFRELARAPWEPRAAFQADNEEVVLLGGRVQQGMLKNDVRAWVLQPDVDRSDFVVTVCYAQSPTACVSLDFAATKKVSSLGLCSHSNDPARCSCRVCLGARRFFKMFVEGVWILGGCGEAAGVVLGDVWHSSDLQTWSQVQPSAPWGPRVGASAVTLSFGDITGVLLFGGYSYPDDDFGPLSHGVHVEEATWFSSDGQLWHSFGPEILAWTSGTTQSAAVAAPCNMSGQPSRGEQCAYIAAGANREGYYENSVRRLRLGLQEAGIIGNMILPASGGLLPVSLHGRLSGYPGK
ncbi:ADO2 [Symbiodinium pilosum]|uniref:ADO2 protein n=1 Tax=Symbiodinium pilosum TaxID=2952 RepID=A0A812Y8G3_SYMPI|nr:ADO2 [Symbiodinium pilosum]